MNLLALFGLSFKSSLLSTGGLGNLPILHDDLVARGWAGPQQFAEALAVGQFSPGPNGLWVVSLGYLLGSWAGAGVVLLSICLPPLLALAIERLYRRFRTHPAVVGALHGLNLAVAGVFAAVLLQVLQADRIDTVSVALAAAAFALGTVRRVPIPVILALAAAVGILTR